MYRLRWNAPGVIRLSDGAVIMPDPEGRHWRTYMEWLFSGNEPLPAEEPPPVPRPRLPKAVIVMRLTDEELEIFKAVKPTLPARLIFLWDEALNNTINAEDERLVTAFTQILGSEARALEVLSPEN